MQAHVALVAGVLEALVEVGLGQNHDAVHDAGAHHAERAASVAALELKITIEAGRVHQHLVDLVPLPVAEAEDGNDRAGAHQYKSLGVDVGADAGDALLAQEHHQLAPKAHLLPRQQGAEKGHVPLQHHLPVGREGAGQDRAPAPDLAQHEAPNQPGGADADRHHYPYRRDGVSGDKDKRQAGEKHDSREDVRRQNAAALEGGVQGGGRVGCVGAQVGAPRVRPSGMCARVEPTPARARRLHDEAGSARRRPVRLP